MRERTNKIELEAFTLVELVVVMILMGVLILLLGSTFFGINSYHHRLLQRSTTTATIKEAKATLRRDLSMAKDWEIGQTELVFYRDEDTVTYVFGPSLIRVHSLRSDTLSIQASLLSDSEGATVVMNHSVHDWRWRLYRPQSSEGKYRMEALEL
ncbi:MAG: type II secretion system protein [Bacteroidota bacterium]